MQTALIFAGVTLLIALLFGILPIKWSTFNDQKKLKMFTTIASGIILASALLVVIPEGFELAGGTQHQDEIGGDVSLVILEYESGAINNTTAIEEIEALLGGHAAHQEEAQSESGGDLGEEILHVIEEVENGDIDASTGIAEIQALVLSHGHEEGAVSETPNAVYGVAIILGFLLMLALEASGAGHAVHEEHHDHTNEHGHSHIHHQQMGWTLVAGLSLHALADGLAIGAAIASGEAALTTAVIGAVLIHKAPAAFSLGVFSKHEHEDEGKAVRDVVLFSVATPIALLIAAFALTGIATTTLGLVMLFAAGSFLYVATVDTLPDMHNPETGKETLIPLLVGVAIVGLLLLLASQMGWLEHGH